MARPNHSFVPPAKSDSKPHFGYNACTLGSMAKCFFSHTNALPEAHNTVDQCVNIRSAARRSVTNALRHSIIAPTSKKYHNLRLCISVYDHICEITTSTITVMTMGMFGVFYLFAVQA